MPRTRSLIRACKDCGIVESSTVYLSARGLCSPCALQRMADTHLQLHQKEGPIYDKWRANLARSLDGKGKD